MAFGIEIAHHCALDFRFRKYFLTGSERSGERLLEAARKESGSESINRINRKEVKKNLKLETGNRRGSGELLVASDW
jgi:hypothetical protein